MKIAIAILTKNEEKRIEQLKKDLETAAVDTIFFFDDHSEDNTAQEVHKQFAGKFNLVFQQLATKKNKMSFKRNEILNYLEDEYSYVLFIDADERFDPTFLASIQAIIQNNLEAKAFAFPRINLSVLESFPDYQVRLLKLGHFDNGELEWRGDVHDQVYWSNDDTLIIETESCVILKDYPILHYKRNLDNKRDWW